LGQRGLGGDGGGRIGFLLLARDDPALVQRLRPVGGMAFGFGIGGGALFRRARGGERFLEQRGFDTRQPLTSRNALAHVNGHLGENAFDPWGECRVVVRRGDDASRQAEPFGHRLGRRRGNAHRGSLDVGGVRPTMARCRRRGRDQNRQRKSRLRTHRVGSGASRIRSA
jgi:hypothetical protein